jgi:hypothetical protein
MPERTGSSTPPSNPTPAPAGPRAKGPVTLKNTRNDKLYFVKREDDVEDLLVIGSAMDHDGAIKPRGRERDPLFQPNPFVRLTETEFNELPDETRILLKQLRDDGHIEGTGF